MTQSTGEEAGREGLFAALKNSLATLISIGKTRAELLVTELEEEKYRLMSLWSKAIGAAFMLAVGVILAIFAWRWPFGNKGYLFLPYLQCCSLVAGFG